MKMYDVSFLKNEIYQSNIVKTDKSPVEVALYFKDVKQAKVLSVDEATADDLKPGKPILQI